MTLISIMKAEQRLNLDVERLLWTNFIILADRIQKNDRFVEVHEIRYTPMYDLTFSRKNIEGQS